MKKYFLIVILIFLQSSFLFSQYDIEKVRNNEITSQEIYEHIKYLASDKLEGRFPGTESDLLSRQYISNEFEKYGLIPKGDSAYIQRFQMNMGLKEGTENSFSIISNGDIVGYDNKMFIPIKISANGKASGELVFAGYGIHSSKLGYSDFTDKNGKEIDVKGKIIIIMRNTPTTMNTQNDKFAQFEELQSKVSALKEKKPAGIILISGPVGDMSSSNTDPLIQLTTSSFTYNSGIPIIHIKRSIIEKLLKERGYDLSKIQNGINESLKPNCFEIKNASASFNVDLKEVLVNTGNVLGFLEGTDAVLKNEVVVVGAHFDHLGYGGSNSLYQGMDKRIHYGADDNASGTAGVLELAQKMTSVKNNKRSILFMCFTGEEEGLIGSSYFAKSDKAKEFNIVAMINMDMIGRLKEDKLILNGTGTSSYWIPKLDELNKNYNFQTAYNPDGFGPSDHSSFYSNNIPVLMFFTDLHDDYHRPSDTYDKINVTGEEKVLKFVYDLTSDLTNADVKPDFTKAVVKEEDNKTERKSVRVYVGTVPDFSYSGNGFKISGVSSGSPAEKYGLQAGDIMIKFGAKEIGNIYDYTAALGEYKPGQEVDVVVKRGEEEVTLKVVLGKK